VEGDTLRARIRDLVEDPTPWLDICSTMHKFRLAPEVLHIPTDDILAGPLLTLSKANGIFIINHRPSPEATYVIC